MDLSIRKDASDASEDVPSEKDTGESEDVPSEEVTSESFPNEEDIETAALLVTADPLANLKADFESLKADLVSQKTEADFMSQLNIQQTKADFESQLGSLKADFESQLESQNAGIKSLKKSAHKSSRSRLEDDGKRQLPPDTFSFLVCSKILSQPFVLGVTIFLFQMTIYGLLAVDLINPFSDNPLRIPENVETNVRITQFLAVIVAVLTQADLRTSLEQVNEGYNQDRIGNEFADASWGKWWLATAFRFLQGALGLVVTFFLIVIVDDVLELLLNFTAMEFVSQLDNVAFFLAGTGYFGSKNAEKSKEIEETSYPQAADEKKRRKTLHVILLVVVFSGTLAGWGYIVKKQISNKYLCDQFFVYSKQTQLIENGVYKLTPSGRNDEHVQYINQKGTEESESETQFGFGYCDEETAWTFYTREGEPCEFTAKSAETTSFDIRTTLSFPWVSENLVQLDPIQLLCVGTSNTLPSEIGNLSGLTFLDLSSQSLKGSLPVELGNLSELTFLDLSSNSFTGAIPSEIGFLTSLTLLDLSGNVGLNGMVPTELKALTELQDLDLSGTALTGSLPLDFCIGNINQFTADCAGGKEADFQCACCTVCCERIGDEPDSCVQNTMHDWLGPLIVATDITLLQDPSTPQYEALDWLLFVDRFIIPEQDTDAESYRYRYIERYVAALLFFSSNMRDWLGDMRDGLGYIEFKEDVSVCKWQYFLDRGFLLCDDGPFVTRVDLAITPFSGSLPSELALLTSLESLDFRNAAGEVLGSIPTEFGKLTNLLTINLGNNKQQEGSIPSEIGLLASLTLLGLEYNNLSGTIPSEIGLLTNLTELKVYKNQLSGSIPSEIGLLNNLTEFEVYRNELSGRIPSEIGLLTSLTEFNVYRNELSGRIPSEIGLLTRLTKLDVYMNKLSGTIPSEIGLLTSLEDVYLNSNNFQGPLPSEIENLPNLYCLDYTRNWTCD